MCKYYITEMHRLDIVTDTKLILSTGHCVCVFWTKSIMFVCVESKIIKVQTEIPSSRVLICLTEYYIVI